jgi:CheY-like chemotaxis protein
MEQWSVVLVDDDTDDMTFLREAMEESGRFHVIASCEAESGLIDVLQHAGKLPDAIVCDLNLPIKNGIDVHKDLRSLQHLADIPFVLISGSEPSSSLGAKAAKEGLKAVMLKPSTIKGYRDFCLQLYKLLVEKRV